MGHRFERRTPRADATGGDSVARMRTLVALLAAALVAPAAVAAAPASRALSACTAGMTTGGGAQARVFCGPAKATVQIGGKTLTFKGGSCERTSTYVALNIGTVVLGSTS